MREHAQIDELSARRLRLQKEKGQSEARARELEEALEKERSEELRVKQKLAEMEEDFSQATRRVEDAWRFRVQMSPCACVKSLWRRHIDGCFIAHLSPQGNLRQNNLRTHHMKIGPRLNTRQTSFLMSLHFLHPLVPHLLLLKGKKTCQFGRLM